MENGEYIGKVYLSYKNYTGKDLYSDGKIEDEILEIVKNNNKNDFDRIINLKNSWPIRYHLSEERENIIDWIPITKKDSVLEIGSGCGAITGGIAKKAKNVTCIELSKKRSLINAYKNKEMDNIEIIVGNFEDIEFETEKKFDYITLIGVYEYAESYIKSDNPYIEFIEKLSKNLKKNGKLIIAIENKFGLKYWAGSKEDHVDNYFEGIEGYRKTYGVKTFSNKELEKNINEAGFNIIEWYYPYPDYKFPQIIYSDYFLPKIGELTDNKGNFDSDRIVLFDEGKVYDNIIRNNMFKIFSNSYLLIIK